MNDIEPGARTRNALLFKVSLCATNHKTIIRSKIELQENILCNNIKDILFIFIH